MTKNKKGQEGVIITVILVLVAIAAVAAIAYFIMNFVRDNTQKIESTAISNLEIRAIKINSTSAIIAVHNLNNYDVNKIRIVLGNNENSKSYDISQVIGKLETKTFIISPLPFVDITSVQIYPLFNTSNPDKDILGKKSDEFNSKNPITNFGSWFTSENITGTIINGNTENIIPNLMPINGECNSTTTFNSFLNTPNNEILCFQGNYSTINSNSSNYIWNCNGINNGNNVSCYARKLFNLSLGLVAYWPFENNAFDALGRYNGTVTNVVYTDEGSYGGAYTFNGIYSEIKFPGSNVINTIKNFSVSIWIKLNSITNAQIFFAKGGTSGGVNDLEVGINTWDTSGNMGGVITRGGKDYEFYENTSIVNNITTGTWYHYVFVIDGVTIKVYRNGIMTANEPAPGDGRTSSSYEVFIGKRQEQNMYCANGTIDEVKIWNRSLSAEEIYQEYMA